MDITKNLIEPVRIKNAIMDNIARYLQEDLGEEGDITSDALFNEEKVSAKIVAKEDCVVSGLEEAKMIFKRVGGYVELQVNDGEFVKANTSVALISGKVRAILKGERLALNIVCRMSGISTETRKLVDTCRALNPNIKIAATRKTTPGFRKYEKKAIILGGGEPHRYGLFDAVMIKDNHIKCIGSLEEAIRRVKQKIVNKIIEVEVENEHEALLVAKLKVDIIMLDNIDPISAKEITKKIKEIDTNIIVEISGRVTKDNILDYASFADWISLGYLTHSIHSKDFSLEIIEII